MGGIESQRLPQGKNKISIFIIYIIISVVLVLLIGHTVWNALGKHKGIA